MVLTIEPGLYVAEDAAAPAEFRGLGVRIEDDILVTATGGENLTAATPKSVADLEALTRQGGLELSSRRRRTAATWSRRT